MNAASLAAATSNGTAAAIRRSRVHGLDGFVTRSLLRTVSCGRTSLNQRESGTGISKEGSSATSTTTTTTRAAAAAPGERLYRPLSLVSQPSRAFATHARRAASAALVAIPLTRAAGRDTTGGSRSSFGGNVASDGREAAAAAAAAATAAIAFAAAQSVEEGNGRIGVGAGAGNSLAWCREEEGMWSSQREDRLPFSGATAGGATAAAAVEDDFTSAASATAAGATRRGDIDTPERLSAGYPLQQTQQHHHHDQHQRAAAAVGSEEAAAMLNGGSSTTSDCRGQLDDLARLEHMGGGNLKQKAVAATLRITDVYRFDSGDQPVGRGNRSIVTTATHRLTGLPVAVKRISRADTSRLEVLEEVQMLKIAGAHPNVVTMQAFFEDKEAYYIVMDLCQGGELYHRLADKGRYSEGQAARIMAEVAEAVGFLHSNGIIHFDLKPENIMLVVGDDCVPEVRLTDFGSAFRQHRPVHTAKDCTIAYSAPEVLACQDVDEKVDMWALGVVMWVLLTGRHPFDTEVDLTEEEVAWRVVNEDPDLRYRGIRHVSPEGKDLVRRLLAKDPEDRPSARQMLSHPWFHAVMSRARMPLRQAARTTPSSAAASSSSTSASSSLSSPGRRHRHTAEPALRTPRQCQHQRQNGAAGGSVGGVATAVKGGVFEAAAVVASVTGGEAISL